MDSRELLTREKSLKCKAHLKLSSAARIIKKNRFKNVVNKKNGSLNVNLGIKN